MVKNELLDQVDDPTDFTAASLAKLDATLRCPICGEHFQGPVSLNGCSHSFCSRCLYENLGETKRCPSCRAETDAGRIKKNTQLEEVVEAWRQARPALLLLQSYSAPKPSPSASKPKSRRSSSSRTKPVASTSESAFSSEEDSEPTRSYATRSSAVSSKELKKGQSGAKSGKGKAKAKQVEPESSDVEVIEVLSKGSKPATKGTAKVNDAEPDPSEHVVCPICQGDFTYIKLNLHIDKCDGTKPPKLGSSKAWGQLMATASSKNAPKRKVATKSASSKTESPPPAKERKLPLVSYTNIKEKKLVEWLKDLGVPISVPLKTINKVGYLIRRHSQWTILWNSNCDISSSDHKSKGQLLAELTKWEQIHDQASQTTARDLDSDYEEENEDAFRDLTRAMKARAASKPTLSPTPIAALSSPATLKPTSTIPRTTVTFAAEPLEYLSPSPSHSGDSVDSPPFTVPPPFPRQEEEEGRKRVREEEPFDPEGPRPSQRIRGEEWGEGGEDDAEEDGDEEQQREEDGRAEGMDTSINGTVDAAE